MSSRLVGQTRNVMVMPGEVLGVIEEYVPGVGVYVDADGTIRAAVSGAVHYDKARRVVYVEPVRREFLPPPSRGDVVLGVVTNIRPELVIVEIHAKARITSGGLQVIGEYKGKLTGAIPIAHIADERIRDIYDYFRIGDVILAKTLNSTNPYTLSTKDPSMGVLFAECAKCGSPLLPASDRTMKCPRCGNVEPRKVSSFAGNKIVIRYIRWWLKVPHRL